MQHIVFHIFLAFYFVSAPATVVTDRDGIEPVMSHDFHMSRTTINYDKEEAALQITTNLFLDDLELALERYGADSLMLCTTKEHIDSESYILMYIRDHLQLSVDGKPATPQWVGKEQSEDLAGVWCYLEVLEVPSWRALDIKNTIMIELYDDQKNMTSVQVDKERVTDYLFTDKKTVKTVELDD